MNKEQMIAAFRELDPLILQPTRIIVGGGAALVAAHGIPVVTEDVDGIPDKTSLNLSEIKSAVREVGIKLKLSQTWLNDYFSPYLFVLPSDYGSRLIPLFKGKNLQADALGKEDLLLMKCFAGREKDIPHARLLIRKGTDLKVVDRRLQELLEKNLPSARQAADLFDDLCGEMGVTP